MQISEITKTIVNVATLVVSIGTLVLQYTTGFLPANVAFWISGGVALAGAVLQYLAPNTTTDPEVAKTQSVRLRVVKPPRKRAEKAAA